MHFDLLYEDLGCSLEIMSCLLFREILVGCIWSYTFLFVEAVCKSAMTAICENFMMVCWKVQKLYVFFLLFSFLFYLHLIIFWHYVFALQVRFITRDPPVLHKYAHYLTHLQYTP